LRIKAYTYVEGSATHRNLVHQLKKSQKSVNKSEINTLNQKSKEKIKNQGKKLEIKVRNQKSRQEIKNQEGNRRNQLIILNLIKRRDLHALASFVA